MQLSTEPLPTLSWSLVGLRSSFSDRAGQPDNDNNHDNQSYHQIVIVTIISGPKSGHYLGFSVRHKTRLKDAFKGQKSAPYMYFLSENAPPTPCPHWNFSENSSVLVASLNLVKFCSYY